jgi:hypothetical protein
VLAQGENSDCSFEGGISSDLPDWAYRHSTEHVVLSGLDAQRVLQFFLFLGWQN